MRKKNKSPRAISTTKADFWFSRCVRKRAGWKCERCHAEFGGPHQGLHCAHNWTRRIKSIRHDPRNAASLCHGCHMHLTAHHDLHEAFFIERLGVYDYEALRERKEDHTFGQMCARSVTEIAAHYKAEFERMGEGEEFVGWA